MKSVERDVIITPTKVHQGDGRANSYLPLNGGINPFHSTSPIGATSPSSESSAASFMASPVVAPDHRFHVDTVGIRANNCSLDPGHGAIPVELGLSDQVILDDADLIHINHS